MPGWVGSVGHQLLVSRVTETLALAARGCGSYGRIPGNAGLFFTEVTKGNFPQKKITKYTLKSLRCFLMSRRCPELLWRCFRVCRALGQRHLTFEEGQANIKRPQT